MLKDRTKLPAGGFYFYEAKTGWSPPKMLDFETTAKAIRSHRSANPRYAGQWSLDLDAIRNELDKQTCHSLAKRGLADQYCTEGTQSFLQSPAPRQQWLGKSLERSAAVVRNMAAGVKTIVDWVGDELRPVESGVAERRASICAECKLNRAVSIGDFFAKEASDLIHAQMEAKANMQLSTPSDEKLGVCEACDCPLKLKVWAPITHIKRHMKPGTISKLDRACWITKE